MTLDAAERSLLDQSLTAALEMHGDAVATDAALADLGWADMITTEPADVIAVVFEVLGRVNAAACVLDDVVLTALGRPPGGAVLLPRWGSGGPVHAHTVEGLCSSRIHDASVLTVVTDDGLLEVPATSATVRIGNGADPDLGLVETVVADPVPTAEPSRVDWPAALAAGRLALGHWLLGTATAMVTLARDHATERVQFGRPIAGFQAVRHKLADAQVALEAARAALEVADRDHSPTNVDLGRILAGRAATLAATHAQQILAGIGFTLEHPFHRYLRRTLVLDGLLGSTDSITRDVGRTVIAERRLPALVDL